MWQQVKADMLFRGDSFKLPQNHSHLTFVLLDDPVIEGPSHKEKVKLRSRVSGNGATKNIVVPYGSFVSTWVKDR